MNVIDFIVNFIFVCSCTVLQQIWHYLFAFYNYRWRRTRLPPIKDDILFIPANELAIKILKRHLRSEAVVAAYIARLRAINPFMNAVCCERYELALQEARAVDAKLDGQRDPPLGGWPPLLGVPVTIKEAFAVTGFQHTGGLKSRTGFIAKEDAVAVAKLRKAGAIVLVTTNLAELGMWWESHNHVYGITRNPYNLACIVGGSSGGEGAVVGAAGSVAGLGSDIGGSIRMPAFFCGVFGHKGTTGIVESGGEFPECSSANEWYMLSVGPICRYATDLPLFLSVLIKPSIAAELRLFDPVDLTKLKYFSLEDWGRKAYLTDAVDKELINAQQSVVKVWSDNVGAGVISLSLPELFYALQMWTGMISERDSSSSSPTISQLMAGGPPQDLNVFKELTSRITGRSDHTLAAIGYAALEQLCDNHDEIANQAAQCRLLKDKIVDILGNDGVLFTPIHPKVGYYHHEPLLHPDNFTYTGIWNALGFPATAVPLGLGKNGLPLGIQVVSNLNNDRYCLAVATKLEELFGGWVAPN